MKKRSFSMGYFSLALLIAQFGLTVSAFGVHLHRSIASDAKTDNSLCVFPDGTSPSGRPGIHCYTPDQFKQAYGIDELGRRGLTGKGQTIIFVDSFGSPTMQDDLDHFSDTFNLPRTTIEFIYPNGPFTNPLDTEEKVGWAQETTLDLEWGHALAPEARLVNIVSSSAESTGMNGMQDLFDGINIAIRKYPNAIVSMSFATSEQTFTDSDVTTFLRGSLHKTFQAATNAGFTLLAGSGDNGSTNINTDQDSLLGFPNTNYPASDPLVTAVGGTAMQSGWRWNPQGVADDFWNCKVKKLASCPTDYLNSDAAPGKIVESVWNEDWALAGSGGGFSTVFPAPTFQSKLDPRVKTVAANRRTLPDVSMNAAINGGVAVYTSFEAPLFGADGPSWQSFGGTSCATPETAALVALAGHEASIQLGSTVGIGALNPILYSLPKEDFNDVVSQTFGNVTVDNNALYFNKTYAKAVGPKKMPPVPVSGYPTTPGYDLATGLGSPKAANFVLDIAKARVAR